jgi:hypothetical protein
MRAILSSCAAALVLAATCGGDAGASRSPSSVDECLRAHGWPYGLVALRRAEIEHGHPNGLIRICHAPAPEPARQALVAHKR